MKPAFTLHSPETQTDYWIYTDSSIPRQEKLRVFLFLDGDDQFATALRAYRQLRKEETFPALLLVGVGYGASYRRPENRRIRDYTADAHTDDPESGGGQAFLRFLTDTLWHELSSRFVVHEDWRGLGGHSLGALLATQALLLQPPFFTHILASAPSLWWADRSILDTVAQHRKTHPHLPARAYFSVGEDDTASMTGDLSLLESQLAKHPWDGLDTCFQRFPGKDHFNVVEDAFTSGLRWLVQGKASH